MVREMEEVKTESDKPVAEVLIADCGELDATSGVSSANGQVD